MSVTNVDGSVQGLMVAVGREIARRPRTDPGNALLTHRAPPSGSGVEAMQRLRVQYPDWREEAIGHADELVPMKERTRTLTAPFEGLQPAPANLSDEPPQARVLPETA
jgi:hypothetical protein